MKRGRCVHCGQPFEYVQKRIKLKFQTGQSQGKGNKEVWRRVNRRVCPACAQARKQWLHKKNDHRCPHKLGIGAKPGEFRGKREIGEALGLTLGQVEVLERSALSKLRNSPELRAAYDNFKEEGMPLLDQLVALLRQPGDDRLLEHQLELMDFWRVYDEARRAGLTAESREILDAIARCWGVVDIELKQKQGYLTAKNAENA